MAALPRQQSATSACPHSVPCVDIELLIKHPKKALESVLRLLPGWEKASVSDLSVDQLSGAMTNLVYRCARLADGKEQEVVLVRIHASKSDLFDREKEIATFKAVGSTGLGPALRLLFGNGRVEEFLVNHVTLSAADLRDTDVSAAIATALASFHLQLSETLASSRHHQEPVVCWQRLQAWLRLAKEVCGAPLSAELHLEGLEDEISALEAYLMSRHPCWLAMCHNDLQYGNIMALPAPLEQLGSAGSQQAAAAAGALQERHFAVPGSAPMDLPPSSLGLSSKLAALALTATPAGSSPASSSSSFVMLRGRRGSKVQLADGSTVLPGLKARVRGQSPDSKRPEGSCSSQVWLSGGCSSVGATVASSSIPGEGGSWSGLEGYSEAEEDEEEADSVDAVAAAAGLGAKPTGRAALRLKKAASAHGLSMLLVDAAPAAASTTGPGKVGRGQFKGGPTLAGAGTGEPASSSLSRPDDNDASSVDSDDLLPPTALEGAGRWMAAEVVGSRGRSGRATRQLRQACRTPAMGIEFPAFGSTSDLGDLELADSGCEEEGQGEGSMGMCDDDEGPLAPAPSFSSSAIPGYSTACRLTGSPLVQVAAADSIRLIDYEYSAFNPVALDLANHWCEWAANYHTEQGHVLDFNKLPSQEQQQHFVAHYLRALLTQVRLVLPAPAAAEAWSASGDAFASAAGAGLDGSCFAEPAGEGVGASMTEVGPGSQVRDQDRPVSVSNAPGRATPSPMQLRSVIEWLQLHSGGKPISPGQQLDAAAWGRLQASLMAAARAYMAVSHLQWALWGYIQAQVSDVDFDFMSYGQQRWEQYLLTRPADMAGIA